MKSVETIYGLHAVRAMLARHPERVRETFYKAALLSSVIMAILTLLAHLRPEWLVAAFSDDARVVDVGATFFRIMSWNFVAQGVIFTCSSLFQGLGDTRPTLISTGTRIVTFALPAIWLSRQEGFQLEQIWYLSLAAVLLQMVISLLLLRRQFRRLLPLPSHAMGEA